MPLHYSIGTGGLSVMSIDSSWEKRILLAGKILNLVLLAVVALLSGRLPAYIDLHGLIFVLVGGIAGALMTFSGSEIRAALAHAGGTPGSENEAGKPAVFWEATARNFWTVGVLRSILNFVITLGSLSGGLAALTSGLANSLLAALYGMVLTVVCYVPYWKLEWHRRRALAPGGTAIPAPTVRGETSGWAVTHVVGYALFVALLLSTLLGSNVTGARAAAGWIVYWPSLLVVFGGTLALLLFLGDAALTSAISPIFAVTGTIGCLMGFVQVLLGISAGRIEAVSSGVTFILSSCFAALLGIFLIGAPLEDRAAKGSGAVARTPLSRVAWYVFPLLALVFLVMVFVLIVTPFERHQ